MKAPTLDRHVADDEIVRLLDAEHETAEAGILRAHLAACPQCTARQGVLERRSRNLSALLTASDPAMPDMRAPAGVNTGALDIARARQRTRTVQPWLRAAAILVLLAGAALMAPPVRAWLAERVGAFAANGPAPEESVQPSPATSSVSFVPAGALLTVDVVAVTAGADLRFIQSADGEVTARALGPGESEMRVLSAGLRLESAARMIFEVAVPASVARIRVVGVDREVVAVDPARLPQTVRVPVR